MILDIFAVLKKKLYKKLYYLNLKSKVKLSGSLGPSRSKIAFFPPPFLNSIQ